MYVVARGVVGQIVFKALPFIKVQDQVVARRDVFVPPEVTEILHFPVDHKREDKVHGESASCVVRDFLMLPPLILGAPRYSKRGQEAGANVPRNIPAFFQWDWVVLNKLFKSPMQSQIQGHDVPFLQSGSTMTVPEQPMQQVIYDGEVAHGIASPNHILLQQPIFAHDQGVPGPNAANDEGNVTVIAAMGDGHPPRRGFWNAYLWDDLLHRVGNVLVTCGMCIVISGSSAPCGKCFGNLWHVHCN